MIDRFRGTSSAGNLKHALRHQRLIQHDDAVVDKIIAVGELGEHKPGDVLIQQDGADDHVFFILAGDAQIEVNGRIVATRSVNDGVGEMAAVDPSAPRSATVRVTSKMVTWRIAAADFLKIAYEYPKVWHATATVIAERLRQRHRFHRTPNAQPTMFVGSSVEGLAIAKNIQLIMQHEPVQVRIWTDGVFGPSATPIDKLLEQVDEADFAVFVFGPDDKIASRSATHDAPRDNIVLEMGLFLTRLGKERTYMVKEQHTDLKIPSDLIGVTPITYVNKPGADLQVVLGPVCTVLAKQIRELGSL